MGHLLFHGRDEYGNQVYSVGRGISKALIPAMRNPAITLCRNSPFDERFLFINCSSTVPPLMTLGGFFSRGLHLDFIGVPLLTAGVHQTYYNITKLIEKSKEICLEYSKLNCKFKCHPYFVSPYFVYCQVMFADVKGGAQRSSFYP